MLHTDKVHVYERIPGTTDVRMTGLHPYMRFCIEDEPPVFVQDGRFYYAGGEEVNTVPEWVTAEVEKLSPSMRDEIGLPKKNKK